ncbi:MAG: hypothetical protein IJP03_04880, partial [Christensenellaceae bacterium]|nr:hypothetical protein [Christensenellaceae bacterium]
MRRDDEFMATEKRQRPLVRRVMPVQGEEPQAEVRSSSRLESSRDELELQVMPVRRVRVRSAGQEAPEEQPRPEPRQRVRRTVILPEEEAAPARRSRRLATAPAEE